MVSAELLAAFAVNGIVLGSILALAAIGLTLVYGILNLTNFAHGDYMTLGAYAALYFNLMIVAQNDVTGAVTAALVLAAVIASVPAAEAGLRRGLGEERARRGVTRASKALGLAGLVVLAGLASVGLADMTDSNLVEVLVASLVLAAAWAWGWWLLTRPGLFPGLKAGAARDGSPLKPALYFGVLFVIGFAAPFLLSGALGTFVRGVLWFTGVLVSAAWLLGLRNAVQWEGGARVTATAWLRGAALVAAFLLIGSVLDLALTAIAGELPEDLLRTAALALFALALVGGAVAASTGRLERSERLVLFGAAGVLALIALVRWAGIGGRFTSAMLLPAAMAITIVPLFSIGLDALIWKPLRKQRATVLTLIIVSIGVALALRNILVVRFGGGLRGFQNIALTRFRIGDMIIITRVQVIIVVTAIILILLIHLLLKYTRVGKGLRALSDNIDLARVTGIDVDRMILYVWAIAGALTAVAGVLLAMNVNVNPNLGFDFLLPIFAAVILGGIGSAYGAMAGGLVIGLAMELSVAWVPAYRTAVAFFILILVLLIRPQGLLGGKA